MKRNPNYKVQPGGDGTSENPHTIIVGDAKEKTIEIKGAKLKEQFCSYTYELCSAPSAGDIVNRTGAAIIHDDMRAAFDKLGVHLAVICEEIELKDSVDIENIAEYNSEVHKDNSLEFKIDHYKVHEFKITGSGERECVTLQGEKRLSTNDYVGLKTPSVSFDLFEYKYRLELRDAIDNIKREVEKYMAGKCAPKFEQTEIEFNENATV